jgi:DNA-binding winged helix-turn-helix (wHTH) protein/tetratricopeptide (TPR) repeat protein
VRVLCFSVFELDQATGELTRAGRRVAIAHQSFTVLWLLASRKGDIVTREELQRALWPDGTHVDFDRGLNFCIAAVRRALRDDARHPRFIETLPKRGYRFVAEVHERVLGPAIETPAISWRRAATRLAWAAALPFLFAQGPSPAGAHTRDTTSPQALAAFERGDYETALKLDARFAEAHFAVAWTHKRQADRREVPERQALQQARDAVDRAIALEDAPESRRLLASLRLIVDWDWEGARRDFARALGLAPQWDLGLLSYADFLSAMGDDRGALREMARAEALSPSCDLVFFQSAVLHYRARQYDTALDKLARAAALKPQGTRAEQDWQAQLHDMAFLIHVQRGDWKAAHREAVILADFHRPGTGAASTFATMPDRDAVARFIALSADTTRPEALRGRASNSKAALLSVLAGRNDEALAWLERAAADRESDFAFALRDPAFDVLRGLPRFQTLVVALTQTPRRSSAIG